MHKAIRWIPVVAVAVLPAITEAQGASAWTWGAIGGVNLSSASGNDISNKEMKTGFDIGLTTQRKVNDTWSFVAEGHWTMKGVKSSDSGVDVTASLNYIEFPLLFRGMPATGDTRPFIEFGPALAFNMGCTLEGKAGSTTISGDCKDNESNVNSTDYGLMGGAGLEWMGMGRPWTASVRYNLGLAKVDNESDSKNLNLQFLVGFRFK